MSTLLLCVSHLVPGRVLLQGLRNCPPIPGKSPLVPITRSYFGRKVANEEPAQRHHPNPHATQTPVQPSPRHEVHEGSAAVNIPFNPPGGGGGPGIGGSGTIFPLTSSPLLDAALTTIVGLGMGKSRPPLRPVSFRLLFPNI
jgi:hypothetical protein